MKEEVTFSYGIKDFFSNSNDPNIFIMRTTLFLQFVERTVMEACGERMTHPQITLNQDEPSLKFIIPAESRNLFLRTYNAQIAPAIIQYLSTVTT